MPPIQVTRFHKPIDGLAAFLTPERLREENLDATLDEIVKRDARGFLFRLEGLLRLYDDIAGEPFPGLLVEMKAAEDVIGKYTEKVEYLDFARGVEADPAAIAYLSDEAARTRKTLRDSLPTFPGVLDRIREVVTTHDWESAEKDIRAVVRELARELDKTAEREYDPNDLQAGIHELRRKLRWFLIYVQAMDGAIVLDRTPGPFKLNCYSYLETHPIAQSPFSKVEPNPEVPLRASIPNVYFLALSKVVNELGEIKSMGENLHALEHALLACGADEHAAHVDAIATASRHPKMVLDTPRAARRILRELEGTKLLRRIRKSLVSSVRG